MPYSLASRLFPVDPMIRYVAVNRGGEIVEMEQRPGLRTVNPVESDRMEELIVNPIVLEAVRRRGNLDLDGVGWVLIRYGKLFEALFPYDGGHASVGIELSADAAEVARRVAETLAKTPPPTAESRRPAAISSTSRTSA